MSWRGRDDNRRWNQGRVESRGRSPVWEPRRSPDKHRERYDRDRRHDYDRDRDRRDRDRDRDADRSSSSYRDRHDRRTRDRDRDRRSPRRNEDDETPTPPSPPSISSRRDSDKRSSHSMSRSRSSSKERQDSDKNEDVGPANVSPGDWICNRCGSYNFKRRFVCFKRPCQGKRWEGTIYGGDNDSSIGREAGITKHLLFRRLDALTTEEKILDELKVRCTKTILDSIAGITIGRETLTGASKCLAYINFNSIADSTAAHTELLALDPPLTIDNREVLISFYNQPQKPTKPNPSADYSAYYAQCSNYTASQAMSEADRVNAAAAVAQSAISAAAARNMSWTPVSVPTFVSSTSQATTTAKLPVGDGKTKYTAPDVRTFLYDETSGYYYDPNTGLYYDMKTQYFYNSQTTQYMYWDATTSTYIAASQTQQNTEQPKLPNPPTVTDQNTIVKEPEEKKKKEKEDKVKVAKKIAKDMERWARTLNQKKENSKHNIVMEQHYDNVASKGSADIGFSVLGAGPSLASAPYIREPSPPVTNTEDFLIKKVPDQTPVDDDDGIIDWAKLTCLLCKRKFPSADVLTKHKTLSDLHKQNLLEFNKKNSLLPQTNGYRDRAAERRLKFGEVGEPIIRKQYEPPERFDAAPIMSAPPPSVVDTIGGKMLQKMGWSEGRGLGKTEQGRIAPIEAEQRPALVGLGQKRGIYTPKPGETYRDTVKKLMISRYKEVVGQEDEK